MVLIRNGSAGPASSLCPEIHALLSTAQAESPFLSVEPAQTRSQLRSSSIALSAWSNGSNASVNKPRGVPRVDDRRALNGMFWVLRSGAPWRDLPKSYGPHTTCYNRFVRWRRAGVWDQIMDALAAAHDDAVQMIDTSVVRVHQHGAGYNVACARGTGYPLILISSVPTSTRCTSAWR